MPPSISVAVITRDEEDRIGDALASTAWADEQLVLDSGSTDRTVEIARAAGATVRVEEWRGYGAQKARATELARHDWVLAIDADERVDGEMAAAIRALPDDPGCAAFRMRRRNRFAGDPIRTWPWSWDTSTRLFDRRRCRHDGAIVHEALRVDGPICRLPGVLEHHTYRGWDEFLSTQDEYARLGARKAVDLGQRPRPGDLWLRPTATFVRYWLGRGYLLGGRRGWRLARGTAEGTRLKYQQLRELSRRR